MSGLPYQCEGSWFAALLYTSGKPSGFIMRSEFEFDGETGLWVYCDGALDKTPNVESYVKQLCQLVQDKGHLLLSCKPEHVAIIDRTMQYQPGFYLLEKSIVEGRTFYAFLYGIEQPSTEARKQGLPEAIVYRDGGGLGDVYHAVAVAEEYTKQGFDVCLMTMDKVRHISIGNPFIKRFVPIPTMANEQLWKFLEFWSRRVRLFVVLDWSIEGYLLKKLILSDYFWSDVQRRAVCGKCYGQHVAELTGLKEIPVIRHYGTAKDVEEAERIAKSIQGEVEAAPGTTSYPPKGFIFIQLGGSSAIHKWNPHTPKLVLMLLARTGYSIYLSYTNDHSRLAHQIKTHVAENYGSTDRVVYSVPKRSFGCHVELAKRAAVVLGPETGIMVGLSHEEDVRKVLLVSHSSVSNFTDWKNTVFLTAEGRIPCAACHRLHATFQFCAEDKPTGAALCQAVITAREMFDAIVSPKEYQLWQDEQKFLVVADKEDATAMAGNIGAKVVPVEEGDTPDSLRERLASE